MQHKYLLLTAIVLLLSATTVRAQQGIAVNATGNAPDASAMLDVQSTAKGMLVPRMSAQQRTGITTPATGLLVYDMDSTAFFFYSGTAWAKIATGSATGDNLGNHTATQNVKLNSNWLSNDGGNEGIRVDNNGLVGVGTATPGAKLDVAGNASIGTGNSVTGANSLAVGSGNNVSSSTSFAAGGNNTVSGNGAYTAGGNNVASGINSMAIGFSDTAAGYASFAANRENNAAGNHSAAFGNHSQALSFEEFVIGQFGTSYTPASTTGFNGADRLFNVGNGTSAAATADALTILKNGKTGINNNAPAEKLDVKGNIQATTGSVYANNPGGTPNGSAIMLTSPSNDPGLLIKRGDGSGNQLQRWDVRVTADSTLHFRSNSSNTPMVIRATGNVGIGTTTPHATLDVAGNASVGSGNTVTGAAALAVGVSNNVSSSNSFAAGQNNVITGAAALAVGAGNNVSTSNAFAAGQNNVISGANSFAIGASNTVSGNGSFGSGGNNVVTNINSMAIGLSDTSGGYASFATNRENNASGNHSAAFGYHNQAASFDEFAIGQYSTAYTPASTVNFIGTDRLFNVGNGASTAATSDAFTILKNGKTGIGNNTPVEKLDVVGNIKSTDTVKTAKFKMTNGATAGYVLTSDAAGYATWASAASLSGTGDNLGNHTATQNIQLNNNWLSNDGGAEGIRIDNTGNVSMGTATPVTSSRLTVFGSASFNGADGNFNAGGNRAFMDYSSGYMRVGTLQGGSPSATNGILFLANNTEGMRLMTGGKVGINNTAPAEKLDVVGNIKSSDTVKTGKFKMTNGATAGYVLAGDAAGNAIWTDPATLPVTGDNLGNHTATQNLNMNGKVISADGSSNGLAMGDNGQLIDSGVNGAGTDLAISGAGTRMIWYPKAAAFRAGAVDGSQWDNNSIGAYSVAMGQNNIANGSYASVFGLKNTVSGGGAFTAGWQNNVSGTFGVAFGQQNSVSGYASGTVGLVNNISGGTSFGAGYAVSVTGQTSMAMGRYVSAGGDYSLAFGYNANAAHTGSIVMADTSNIILATDAPNQFKARYQGGYTFYADGIQTNGLRISPTTGVAKYFNNVASSYDARSLVDKNYVDSNVTVAIAAGHDNLGNHIATQTVQLNNNWLSNDGGAEGIRIDNSGNVGLNTATPIAQSRITIPGSASFTGADGNFNAGGNRGLVDYSSGFLRIGTITGGGAANGGIVFLASNAERMRLLANGNLGINNTAAAEKLDVVGNIKSSDTVKTAKFKMTNGAAAGYVLSSDAAGNAIWASPAGLSGMGDNLGNHTATQNILLNNNWLSNDGGAEGIRVDNNGKVGIGTATPGANLDVAGTFVSGISNVASGAQSVALNQSNVAAGANSIAAGNLSYVSGNQSIAAGNKDTTTGLAAAALGEDNNATGDYSFTTGYNNLASGKSSVAMGDNNIANTIRSFAIGQNNTASGWGAGAMGLYNAASGNAAMVLGSSSSAAGTTAISLGYENTASGNYSVAVGRRANTNGKAGSFVFGDSTTNDSYSDAVNQMKMRFQGGYKLYADAAQANGLQIVPATGVAKYFNNVASSYDARSLVDKNYVDSNVSSRITGIVETDPQVSSTATNKVPKWNGTTLVDGQIYDDGTNLGIGTTTPNAPLHVLAAQGKAKIQSTNDVPTYLALTTQFRNWIIGNNRPSDNNGALDGFYVYDSTATATRLYIDPNGNTGIGTTTPGAKLDVVGNINSSGTVKTNLLQMTNGATAGYILTSDAAGNATWTSPAAAGTTHTLTASGTNVTSTVNGVPATLNIAPAVNAAETDPQVSSATTNKVPKWNGTTLVDGVMTDDGTNVGIGTTTPGAKLDVAGIMRVTGSTAANLELNSPTTPTIYPNGSLTPANQNMEVRSAGGGTLALNFSNAGSIQMAAGGGGVLIGTGATVAAKLDVNGTFKLGSSGTPLSNIIKVGGVTGPYTLPANTYASFTYAATGAALNATAFASPSTAMTDGLIISYAYVNAANQVTVRIANTTGSSVVMNSPNLLITIIN